MKKIAFYQPHICIHGTTVSYNEYAKYNREILGNESLMFYDKSNHTNDDKIIEKFSKHTEVIGLDGKLNMPQLAKYLRDRKCDALYIQKCGRKNDGRFVPDIPNLIHVVGWENDPHGHRYAYVSKWMSEKCSDSKHPYVPYIVDLPETEENLRKEYDIPEDAIVFGRLGGLHGWDIDFAERAIEYILKKRSDIYFLFAQTRRFSNHKRAIFIDKISDIVEKRKFINSSDAMIHARYVGESFGMACAEFSFCNKPVITYFGSNERNHIDTLGKNGLYYNNYDELTKILSNFQKTDGDFNSYREFSPKNVMNKFKEVFLNRL